MDKTCWQRTEQRKGEEREESAKSVRRPLRVRLLQLGCLFRVSQDRSPRGAFWLSSLHTSQVLFTEQPQGSSSTGCFLMCSTKARQFLRQPAAATRTERERLAGPKGTTLTPRSKSFFLASRWPLAGCYHIGFLAALHEPSVQTLRRLE